MHWQPYPSADAALTAARTALARALHGAISENKPILLLLSGGSNIRVARSIEPSVWEYSQLTALVLDERFSADAEYNNSLQLQDLGLPVLITAPESGEAAIDFGKRFDRILRDWFVQHSDGVCIATIGMGGDGHVAGISPFPENAETFNVLFGGEQLAIGYNGHLNPSERVTVTPHFLQTKLDVGIVYIVGESKKTALDLIKDPETLPHQLPAKVLLDSAADLQVFTDIS